MISETREQVCIVHNPGALKHTGSLGAVIYVDLRRQLQVLPPPPYQATPIICSVHNIEIFTQSSYTPAAPETVLIDHCLSISGTIQLNYTKLRLVIHL